MQKRLQDLQEIKKKKFELADGPQFDSAGSRNNLIGTCIDSGLNLQNDTKGYQKTEGEQEII